MLGMAMGFSVKLGLKWRCGEARTRMCKGADAHSPERIRSRGVEGAMMARNYKVCVYLAESRVWLKAVCKVGWRMVAPRHALPAQSNKIRRTGNQESGTDDKRMCRKGEKGEGEKGCA